MWVGPFSFETGYCDPVYQYGCSNGAKISNFEITNAILNLTNNTGTASCGTNGYNDFTSMSASAPAEFEVAYSVTVGSYSAGVKLWVDWNNNGEFEADELMGESATTITSGNSFTGNFTVPAGTPLGDYRIRARVVESTTTFDPCSQHNYGETEDYTFTVIEAPDCMPPTGIAATPTSLTAVELSWNEGDGIGYEVEWGEAGFDQGDGTLIEDLTNTSTEVTVVTDTEYEFYVRQDCGPDGYSMWVGPFSFETGYCDPVYQYGCSNGAKISNFEITNAILNLTNNTGTASCGTNGYNDFTSMSASAPADFEVSYSVTVGSYSAGVKLWVDWNNNGEFEADELMGESATTITSGNSFTGNFTVPAGTPLGDYRIRARVVESTTTFDPCSQHNYGETEDYTFTVIEAPDCMPPTGIAATPTSLTAVELSWNEGDGIGYEVEWGEAGFDQGDGTLIEDLTNTSTEVTVVTDTEYEFYVRQDCGPDGYSMWVGPFSFETGYCDPVYQYGCSNGAKISNFEITNAILNLTNNTGTASCGTNGYNDFTSMSASAPADFEVSYSVTVGSYSAGVKLWVDWNNNGEFEADELMGESATTITSGNSFTGNFTVPAGTPLGDYRIRARVVESTTTFDPCSQHNYGETEDYTFTVIEAPDCMPPTGIAATPTSLTAVELSWNEGDGIGYEVEWGEAGFDQGDGTLIEDLTNTSTEVTVVTDTEYEFYVRQDCGPDGYSMWVGPFSFETGYCDPVYQYGCSNGAKISNFEITNAILNLTNNTGTASCGTNGYNDFTSMSASAPADFEVSYSVTVGSYSAGVKLWVDWNNNGEFEADELMGESATTITSGNSFTGNFTVPAGTPLGDYRIRARVVESTTTFDPCSQHNYGETEDYTFTVIEAPDCMPPTGIAATPTSLTAVELSWNEGDGIGYEVEWGEAGFDQGDGTLIEDLTNTSTEVTVVTDTEYEFYVRQDCGPDGYSMWVGPFSFETGYCDPVYQYGCSNGAKISNFEITNAILNLTNNTGTASCGTNGYNDFTSMSASAPADFEVSYSVTVGSYSAGVKLWVDWNNNGEFEADELMGESATTITSGNSFTGNFTVPAGTPLGDYRIRARVVESTTTFDPCSQHNYGETEDYTFTVIEAPDCMPPTGIAATPTSLTAVELSWNEGDGIGYEVEWGEAGFDQGDGTLIEDLTNTSTEVTVVTDTEYEFYVRQDCGPDGYSMWVGPFSFETGYCDPVYQYGCSNGAKISNFEITNAILNLTNNTGTASCGTNGYNDFTSMSASAPADFEVSYSVTVGSYSAGVKLWVDWNNNGEFEADELMGESATTITSGNSFTGNFTVPAGTPLGDYRIRARVVESTTTFDPCSQHNYGETEDYTFTVIEAPDCMPPTGIAATPTSLTAVELSWNEGDGIGYEVEWGEAGFDQGDGTLIEDLTVTSTEVAVVTDTEYQFYVRQDCGADGYSLWAGPYNFQTGYCDPVYQYGCSNGAKISNFEITNAILNLTNNTGTASCGTNGYNDFTSMSASAPADFEVSYSVTVGSYSAGVKLWVDWNNNGEFEADELMGESATTITSGNSFTGNFTVPAGTPLGDYRIRARVVESTTTFDPCSQHNYGETEDYTFTVIEAPDCMPPTGIAATPTSLTAVELSWNEGDGIGYEVEWGEAGFDQGDGTLIEDLTVTSTEVAVVTDTEYQFYVRQDCGADGYSLWAGPYNFQTGYCDPVYQYGCSNGAKISNFEITNAILNLTNNTGTASCGTNGYNDFTSMSASAPADFEVSYSVTVGSYSAGVKLWVDWNNNGEFEADELMGESATTITSGNSFTGNFTVPAGTPLGDYRIRARVVESTTTFDPCSQHNYGETEDYTFTVIEAPDCMPPTALGAEASSMTEADLSWTSDGDLFDIEWGEAGFDQGDGTIVTDIDETTYNLDNLTPDTEYEFYVRQDCGADGESLWAGPYLFFTGYCEATSTYTSDHITAF